MKDFDEKLKDKLFINLDLDKFTTDREKWDLQLDIKMIPNLVTKMALKIIRDQIIKNHS